MLKTADRGVRASLAIYLVYHTALKKASIVKPFCVTLVQLRREQAPQAGNRNLLFFCRQGRLARLMPDLSDTVAKCRMGTAKKFYTSIASLSPISKVSVHEAAYGCVHCTKASPDLL